MLYGIALFLFQIDTGSLSPGGPKAINLGVKGQSPLEDPALSLLKDIHRLYDTGKTDSERVWQAATDIDHDCNN